MDISKIADSIRARLVDLEAEMKAGDYADAQDSVDEISADLGEIQEILDEKDLR